MGSSRSLTFGLLIFFAVTPLLAAEITSSCTLRSGLPSLTPEKPFPSLTQCYKFNTQSCCVSGHDSVIRDAYSSLLSPTCLLEYPELQSYFCLGCDPYEGEYVDTVNKKVRICKQFADMLFDANKMKYDNCGLKYTPTNGMNPSAVTGSIVLPSTQYANSTQFMMDIKPPFFEQYTMEVVDATTGCLSAASFSATVSLLLLGIATILSVAAPHLF